MKFTKKKTVILSLMLVVLVVFLSACDSTRGETNQKLDTNVEEATTAAAGVVANQPAPTDLDYSLERYNLIRRAYWVNGQREKANALPCEVSKPLGYIVLFSDSGAVVGNFIVDGKVSSLGSYLFPAYIDSTSAGTRGSLIEYSGCSYTEGPVFTTEVPGIDGAYGSNVNGIFFFTNDGKYIEWTGDYLYSDIPFDIDSPVLLTGEK